MKSFTITIILIFAPFLESAQRLNEYIKHHEQLNYNTESVHDSHLRVKRSNTKNDHVFLNFKSFNKEFKIRLKRDLTTFSENLRIDSPKGEIYVDTSHVYQGELVDDNESFVFGSLNNGIFEGKIVTSSDAYYVEHAKHYFPNRSYTTKNFHSVIYNENHVEDPYQHKRTGHFGGCGINENVMQWMDNIQNSGEDEFKEDEIFEYNTNKQIKNTSKFTEDYMYPFEKYSEKNNVKSNNFWHNESLNRVKRANIKTKEEHNKNTCSLYIQTDPLIWRHIREGIADYDKGKTNEIDEKTREEILSLIAHHITAVNYIYRNTKFDGKHHHRNIRFEVQRIKIDDDSACSDSFTGEVNHFCMENIDVSNFLNLHSLGNHEIFCLAYVFTYRDFTGGTLGLAWVASASGASGGICEKYKTYTETVGGLYQSTKRSLNTGIITFVNYNSRVPPKVSQLTLAHEIGHNFGSPHDYPSECRPGGLAGNYIMFASATSGDRPNNSKFSNCSIRNISNVLDAIEESKKRNCFKVSEGAFCGNKIVEIGEECDCGFNEEECKEKCCYPRQISENELSLNATAKGCARRTRTQCSPSQGPCCLHECSFTPANYKAKCKEETECSWSSSCNGSTAECPNPKPKDDKTKCNNGTQLCIKGECAGSICLLWNMTECFLSSTLIPNIDKRKLCELACQNGNDSKTCRSTSEFAQKFNLPKGGISLRPGAPCDNFQGYCDVFLKCRAVDAEGPLVRLKNLLFNKRTLQTVAQWITENWYAAVLIGICFVIVMGIFVKCCAVHTPSSNPKKPPARRISETLRHPMNTIRRMRHPNNNSALAARSIQTPNGRSRRCDPSENIPIPHGHRSSSNRQPNTIPGSSQAYSGNSILQNQQKDSVTSRSQNSTQGQHFQNRIRKADKNSQRPANSKV